MTDSPYLRARRAWPLVAPLGLLAAVLAVAVGRFSRVVVEGDSMLPALSPGERLLVFRSPVIEEGDVICLSDPWCEERLLVKRVTALYAKSVSVKGDNEQLSRDSRAFGPVERSQVVGRAVYRYSPASAAGRLRRARWSATTMRRAPAREPERDRTDEPHS